MSTLSMILYDLLQTLVLSGCFVSASPTAERRWTSTNCSTDLWNVSPPLNYSDPMYAGWDQLPTLTEVELYNGRRFNRTYAHHPQVAYFNETVYLIHTSGVVDEDTMGSEVWGAVSNDYGFTWTETTPYFPAALLPNQTNAENFTYWCDRHIWQRAWDGLTIVQSPDTQKVYAVADSTNFFCIDGDEDTRGAGNIARVMDPSTGQPVGNPCWLTQNEWTNVTLYNETIYGTEWGMQFCEETETLNTLLATPPEVPAWDAKLYNHIFYASNNMTSLQEPTHAVYEPAYDQWRRFWRDISSKPSHKVWTECTIDPSDWYPLNYSVNGPNPVYETNIPDVDAKEYYGSFSVPQNDQVRYLVSNPRNNTEGARYPLAMAWQDYNATSANWQFTHVGVVKTGPAKDFVPGRAKSIGFQYPSATQVGTNLIVTYSENKENIWISVIPLGQI